MKPGPETDIEFLEMMIELASNVEGSLSGFDFDAFANDRDMLDLASFRIGSIGEISTKLRETVRAAHPEIDRHSIYRARNLLFHHYDRIQPRPLWEIVTEHLPPLRAVCEEGLRKLLP